MIYAIVDLDVLALFNRGQDPDLGSGNPVWRTPEEAEDYRDAIGDRVGTIVMGVEADWDSDTRSVPLSTFNSLTKPRRLIKLEHHEEYARPRPVRALHRQPVSQ